MPFGENVTVIAKNSADDRVNSLFIQLPHHFSLCQKKYYLKTIQRVLFLKLYIHVVKHKITLRTSIIITRVLHPCTLASPLPVCFIVAGVLRRRSCASSSLVCFVVAHVLRHRSCASSSLVCFVVANVLRHHSCALSSLV